MPPRQHTAKPAAGRQSTLTFNHRVSKPVAKSIGKDLGVTPSVTAPILVKPEPVSPTELGHIAQLPAHVPAHPVSIKQEHDVQVKAEEVIKEEEQEEDEVPAGDTVEKPQWVLEAENLGEEEVGGYWRVIEMGRGVGGLHQEGLGMGEKVLRYFDVCSHYGPCIGISRRARWERARRLGLHPPIEVLAILLRDEKGLTEKSHIDELLNPAPVAPVE